MNVVGFLQDFQTLISNAGLEHFIDGEPHQYAKLTMSVVQDFRFSWSSPNPITSGKKAISGAPIWTMCGAYGMRHHCHATSTNLSVAHLNMHHT
jgi:hypothetical protein